MAKFMKLEEENTVKCIDDARLSWGYLQKEDLSFFLI